LAPEANEVVAVLKQQLADFQERLALEDVGQVIEVGDGIARVFGLDRVMAQELVEFPGGVMGIALNLEEDNVGCILLGPDENIREGDEVRRTGRIAETIVGEAVFGRVITPLGVPLDGKGPLDASETRPLEVKAPGVMLRQPVKEPLYTGIKAIDAMIPIGRGQRELIIGDRQIGKTAIVIDTIINQKDSGVRCIYVAIGQKLAEVRRLAAVLEKFDALKHTCIVAAAAASPPAELYIAPYAGATIGEYERDNGRHALIIYDDLSKHARAYREVSLLLRRPPGREAFPGDIFYLHARLLERAAKMSDEMGGGSLTALPIIETQEGDYSAYIPTNVISITDGQIYLEPDLFHAGVRPAISVGLSVSRVGGAAQDKMMRQVAGQLRSDLASYREYEAFSQFASDLDERTRRILARGERMVEVLKQKQYMPLHVVDQVIAIFAGARGHWDDVPVSAIADLEKRLLEFVRQEHEGLWQTLDRERALSDETARQLGQVIEEFKQRERQAGRLAAQEKS
jgi:F-type H+-transporting ATPase subunit alpha